MTLRSELQAIPELKTGDHPAVDVLARYMAGPAEESAQMILILHERYPALKQIIDLVEELYSSMSEQTRERFPDAAHFASLGATLGFLCLKEVAEQQVMDPSADPDATI